MTTQPRIRDVSPAKAPFCITVTWYDGKTSTIDLTEPIKELEIFAPLEDADFFARVRPDEWGWSIKWNEDIDLGADTLWRMSLEQKGEAMRPAAFRAWRERSHLSLTQAAAELGLSRRMIVYYEQGRKLIPKTVMLATLGFEASRKQNHLPSLSTWSLGRTEPENLSAMRPLLANNEPYLHSILDVSGGSRPLEALVRQRGQTRLPTLIH